ncbi:mannose-6-phosphate isomerase, class I [Streptomyces yangpuensis]|uniref:mannose-6-phosphate isomerase n=1 Tax=Streptomyces yangpuensis TaxID=1648182 RepID=A0ABY5PVC9_9ACTN|nr:MULTISPECIES: mannose-6-phosphate isomerase, class I [Streptomyces]MBZ9596168.1 mannose-6-phosphate isomerase, class I [Streptomyces erythrochromogenes]UUY48117.1 mannose-6-phosphate isomerase, class I [Streptomyces yangpuensis]
MDRLTNTIRPYAWGSTTALPALLGVEPTGEPQAELWMGAHPGAPSRVDRGAGERSLAEVIAADPEGELGAATVAKFGPGLPFLFKILAAGAPLSLQVHPDLAQAKAGFEEEERRGIPIDAGHRNYKDPNHKPEMICAITTFDGLCGFRSPQASADLFEGLGVGSLKPYADLLRAHPEEAALREVLTAVLTADREQMARTVTETAAAAAHLGGEYATYAALAHEYPGDPGVLAAMLLNHVRLQPGEALFLGAGVPHAYFDGLGVELLANSDNVLRAGLTPKHVDVPELLKIVRFEPSDPAVMRPEGDGGEEVYEAPIDEFRLSRFLLAPGGAPHVLPDGAPQILLCTGGSAQAGELALTPGGSAFVPADEKVELSGNGTVFRATVVV